MLDTVYMCVHQDWHWDYIWCEVKENCKKYDMKFGPKKSHLNTNYIYCDLIANLVWGWTHYTQAAEVKQSKLDVCATQ